MSLYTGLVQTQYQVGDRRWLLAVPDVKLNATLDISKFNQTGTSAVQTITPPASGTFTITYNGQTTAPIAFNATLAAVQAALQALPNIGAGTEGLASTSGYQPGPGGVNVAGTPGTSYVITFAGALANQKVNAMTVSAGSIAQTTQGVTAHYPNGFIPSGCAVGKVTATGLYAPYNPSASDGSQVCAGLIYDDARAVWLAGATTQIADKVGVGLVVYDAMVSQSFLPFKGGPGTVDAAAITALPNISWQA